MLRSCRRAGNRRLAHSDMLLHWLPGESHPPGLQPSSPNMRLRSTPAPVSGLPLTTVPFSPFARGPTLLSDDNETQALPEPRAPDAAGCLLEFLKHLLLRPTTCCLQLAGTTHLLFPPHHPQYCPCSCRTLFKECLGLVAVEVQRYQLTDAGRQQVSQPRFQFRRPQNGMWPSPCLPSCVYHRSVYTIVLLLRRRPPFGKSLSLQ